jgi:hypothetical protein
LDVILLLKDRIAFLAFFVFFGVGIYYIQV